MDRSVVVFGAGGHAKVCVDVLRSSGFEVACCIGTTSDGATCLDVPIVTGEGQLAELRQEGFRNVFVAVGSNELRARLADEAVAAGFQLVNAVSPLAHVASSVELGVGIAIMAGAIIQPDVRIEDLAIINTGASVDHDCRIGRAVHIAPQCGLAGCVEVGEGSMLGVGTSVIPGVKIGSGAIIGAGAAVVRDIPSGSTAVGIPARLVHQVGVDAV